MALKKRNPNKPLYPIRAASKLTGLSVDTLRAWERRYKAVEPAREGRGRKYTEADIERLRLLRSAVEAGHAIGGIAGIDDPDLRQIAESTVRIPLPVAGKLEARKDRTPVDIGPILSSVERFDANFAEEELYRLALLLPPRDLIYRLALPLMHHVGEGWQQGHLNVAQEHLVSALIRNLLGALARISPKATSPPRRLLFATTSGELHEFGTLCAAMLTAAGGLGTTYLGPNLPSEEIAGAARRSNSEIVVLGIVGTGGVKSAIRNVRRVVEKLPPRTELWIGGPRSGELIQTIRSTAAVLLEDFDHLEQQLLRVGARF